MGPRYADLKSEKERERERERELTLVCESPSLFVFDVVSNLFQVSRQLQTNKPSKLTSLEYMNQHASICLVIPEILRVGQCPQHRISKYCEYSRYTKPEYCEYTEVPEAVSLGNTWYVTLFATAVVLGA